MARKLLPFDELNVLEFRIRLSEIGEVSADEAIDSILELLVMAYSNGVDDANDMLGSDIAIDNDKMTDSVYKKVAGKDFEERVREYSNTGSTEDIIRVADTEVHRVYCDGAEDTAVEAGASYKKWITMQDDRVRDTHVPLYGIRIPIGELFTSIDGDSAMRPGGFSKPQNNVNCRCMLEYSY